MSELKVHRFITTDELFPEANAVVLYYDKSEADKVIAHHKYKRCLAMVQVLEHVCPMTNRKAKWRDKWHNRWLKIGQQFKEAK